MKLIHRYKKNKIMKLRKQKFKKTKMNYNKMANKIQKCEV